MDRIRVFFAMTTAAVVLSACRGGDMTAPPLTVTPVGGIPTTAAGDAVGDSIRVRVTDGTTPKSGVSVSFAVTAGGGTVSPASVTTNAQGVAAARFVTNPKVGVNTATATVTGSAPVAFTLTTIAGPATSVVIAPRIAFFDAGQSLTPTVTASDANGNVVPPNQLTFQARTASVVSITPDGVITGSGLAQTIVVASSPLAADSMLVVVTNPGGPVLQSNLTRLDLAHDTTFTVPVVLDMRTSGEKLGATTIMVRWDPTELTFVSQTDGSSAVGALVNATSVSQGVLTLAMASVTGFAGRVELRRITFTAASTVGRSGTLKLSASEVSGAGTFSDLLPRTVGVSYPLSIR